MVNHQKDQKQHMPNTYFQFKHFIIQQEKASLKVSTDSCLFGAWVAFKLQSEKWNVKNILDIGAGTGLLMLMLAQKCDASIDGIEIDEPSCKEATENIESSLWKDRLHLFFGDVKQFQFYHSYDFIISNPPFYEGNLKSAHSNKNIAKHDDGLKLEVLLQIVDRNLTADGRFAVLLPFHRTDEFISKALTYKLLLQKRLDIRQTVNHSFFRSILVFGRNDYENEISELAIKTEFDSYTSTFESLLKEYYLYL